MKLEMRWNRWSQEIEQNKTEREQVIGKIGEDSICCRPDDKKKKKKGTLKAERLQQKLCRPLHQTETDNQTHNGWFLGLGLGICGEERRGGGEKNAERWREGRGRVAQPAVSRERLSTIQHTDTRIAVSSLWLPDWLTDSNETHATRLADATRLQGKSQ